MNGWKQWSEQVSTSSFLEKKAAESLAREGLEGFQALGKDEVGGWCRQELDLLTKAKIPPKSTGFPAEHWNWR